MFYFETESLKVFQTGLELTTLLSQLRSGWDDRHVPTSFRELGILGVCSVTILTPQESEDTPSLSPLLMVVKCAAQRQDKGQRELDLGF